MRGWVNPEDEYARRKGGQVRRKNNKKNNFNFSLLSVNRLNTCKVDIRVILDSIHILRT